MERVLRCSVGTHPQKGDLSKCNNWMGIALLDVVGKVVAGVLQERLQKVKLSESQCGFRKGRTCIDIIFTIRQLVEKSWEQLPSHSSPSLI